MCIPPVNKNNNDYNSTNHQTPTATSSSTTTTNNVHHDGSSASLLAKYQKFAEYPPDKESTWSHPKEDDGWMHAHNSIRAEMALLIAAMDCVVGKSQPLSAAQITAIQTAWRCHYEHVHAHHSNEDDLMVPFLMTRFEYPDQPHEHDHTALVDKLAALQNRAADLSSPDSTTAAAALLLQALKEYQAMMLPHLRAEEEDSLPLMRAFFTPDEISPVVQQILAKSPPFELGSFIDCMGIETFRTKFMVQEGIPDFLWEADFQHRHQSYLDHFVAPLQSLLTSTTGPDNNDDGTIDLARYQKLTEYPPDKESTWTHGQEEDGWMHAHNSIRAEIELLIASIDCVVGKSPLSAAQVSCLQRAWQCHYEHVHAHHSNEDALMVPFLSTRFEYPDQPHEHDHTALVAKLEALHAMVANLSSSPSDGATRGNGAALVQALKEYQVMMLPHLKAEEEESLPLMRAYFTPDEIAPVVQQIVGTGPPFEMGSFIACMGVETFRTKFMVQEGIPDFLWEADFQNRYRFYKEHFTAPLDKLIKIAGFLEI